MYEHPSYTYGRIVVDQERVDRANELRRIIAENPSRVVTHGRPHLDRVRNWFGARRADAKAPSTSSDSPRVTCDHTALPANAR